jgi:hypothetical protein
MKINNLTFILLLGVVLSGLMVAGYVSVHDKAEISRLGSQSQAKTSESYATASISKGTILFLLSVGVIGVLGVSRKKKDIVGPAQKDETNSAPGHQNLNAGKQKPIVKKF